MSARLRISILSSSTVASSEGATYAEPSSIYLSKGKWILPRGRHHERQDRLITPVDFDDEFSLQWSKDKVLTSNALRLFEKENPSLENLNNVFNKFVEPGYSLFFDKDTKPQNMEKLIKSLELDDFSISDENLIKNHLSYEFHKNTNSINLLPPKKLKQFISKKICENESNTDLISQYHLNESENMTFQENCLINYNDLIEKVTSISLEFNNNQNVPSFQKNEQLLNQSSLVITLFWEPGSLSNIESRIFKPQVESESSKNRIIKEIGIFQIDPKASTVNEVNLYGLRATLPSDIEDMDISPNEGQKKQKQKKNDKKHDDLDIEVASKVMFFSQPRHIDLHNSLIYESSFKKPIGLHPVHQIKLDKNPIPPMNDQLFDCELFAYYRLPNSLFIDRNEFVGKQDIQLLGVWGETDLELPSYSVKKWGSDSLFRISPDLIDNDGNEEFSFEIKFHSRYQSVEPQAYYYNSSIAKPNIFWACEISEDKMKSAVEDSHMSEMESDDLLNTFANNVIFKNPLDIKNDFNMESLFTNNTLFYHYDAVNCTSNQDNFTIPIGNLNDYKNISFSLPLIILFSIFYILISIFK